MSAVFHLDRGQRYLVLYNESLFSEEALSALTKECGGGVFIPLNMDLLPEGSRANDALAFYAVGAKRKTA